MKTTICSNRPDSSLLNWLLILSILLLLVSCGDASIEIAGISTPCSPEQGRWEGVTDRGQTISMTLDQDHECNVMGVVAYLPCVPVTPVTGMGNDISFNFFNFETDDGSLTIGNVVNPDWPNDLTQPMRINVYTFRNTQNRPNCSASESGRISISKVS